MTSSRMEYENAGTVSHLCISFPVFKMVLIIVVRIIGCPFDNAQLLVTSLGIMHLLVCFVVRIQLIAVVVGICPICLIVRVILIGPGIQLFLCVGFSRHFFHGFPPFRAKKIHASDRAWKQSHFCLLYTHEIKASAYSAWLNSVV